ncbi:hypothetical protein JAAARDRAFT_339323 [Jaapia argillacea MUCL 33604]|uniref:Protein kinase domain-containing protein n=1 Tax=Jaapia argillacea MUCL 33604 TaxID=933084 RepID=A0A067PJD8_9AGAM|nr:hypothetical protein JAAARDRAFT_339323 [Jaapia argillacea MUCL 33604]
MPRLTGEWEFVQEEISVEAIVGQGGFGEVRTCRWLGGIAAVKVIAPKPQLGSGGATLTNQDFESYLHRQEMESWFRLSHPNVLPFLGTCITSPTPMILTPFAPNGSARSYREKNPHADWLHILNQIALGVKDLHDEALIIHGDIKGSNILISSSITPQIADFGLAKMVQNTYGRVNSGRGTVQWMAPELLGESTSSPSNGAVVRGGRLTYESDMYALGMTLYELWFGTDPFCFLELELVREVVVEEDFRPMRDGDPMMGDVLWEVVEGCWPKDPHGRLRAGQVTEIS